MKYFLKKLSIVWIFIAIIISLFLFLFEGTRLYDYFTNGYLESSMRIDSINFYSSSGRRQVSDIEGAIGKINVYFSLYDEDINHILEYLEIIPDATLEKIGYDDLGKANFFVPVLKFKSSKNVVLIPKQKTKNDALQKWIMPKILLFLIAYIPLITLLIFNKTTSKYD